MCNSWKGSSEIWRQASCIALCWFALGCFRLDAQQPTTTQVMTVDGAVITTATVAGGQPTPNPKGTPKPPTNPNEKGPPGEPNKEGGSPENKKEGAVAEPVKRQSEPPDPPNKKELDVKPDDAGMVQFQFRNQAWPDVLRWLAETSSMSLDWQELPGDYLNLATRRPYSIEETRDLFNRHLLARGYTLLEIDGVLQVSKTENINSALVPKVDPAELAALPPNRFVRVSISLDSLIAEEVIDEFKMLISTNGKLIPLQSTNRLEAMDAAGNLKELYRIVMSEQSEEARSRLAREFVLKHVRSSDVKSQLEMFLGIQKSTSMDSSGSSSSRQMQQMQEMMQQQMQQMQQRGGDQGKGLPDKSKQRPKEIYLVANQRQNSVIVHAQPDKMAIVEAFIQRVDVPNENAEDLSMMQSRMQVYRLASISPKQLVATLLSMDALEPTTQLVVDEDSRAMIAYASLADQYAIQKVVERLDGSARKFEMMQLRRLRADEVAGTVKFLMGTDKEKKEDSSSSRRYYYFDPFSQGGDDKKKQDDAFRVGANVADNQLLLWCNDNERKEVVNLLVKLGEMPPEGAKPSPFRTIDASRSRDTLDYLRQLQEKWKTISPNPLVLPGEDQFDPPQSPSAVEPEGKEKKVPAEDVQTSETSAATRSTARGNGKSIEKYVLADDAPDSEDDDSNLKASSTGSNLTTTSEPVATRAERSPPPSLPPIEIRFDPDGNLLLSSQDLEALDRLETFMLRNAPPQRPYDVFHIKHTRPSYIAINLEDYFKENDKSKNDNSRYTYYFFDGPPQDKRKDDPQLGSKRELRFVWDNDTGTIVAIGATDAQRKLIGELIDLWDTPDPKKDKNARYQKLVKVQYSKAEVIEQAIKDAYRDFLTENDKTFDRNSEDGKKGGEKRDRSESDRKFSMGVDSVTNIIIVSAEGEDLLNVLCEIIEQLDIAARPSGSLEVVQFETGASTKSMEKAFKALMESAKKPAPQDGKQGGEGNDQKGESNNNRNRGDR